MNVILHLVLGALHTRTQVWSEDTLNVVVRGQPQSFYIPSIQDYAEALCLKGPMQASQIGEYVVL